MNALFKKSVALAVIAGVAIAGICYKIITQRRVELTRDDEQKLRKNEELSVAEGRAMLKDRYRNDM